MNGLLLKYLFNRKNAVSRKVNSNSDSFCHFIWYILKWKWKAKILVLTKRSTVPRQHDCFGVIFRGVMHLPVLNAIYLGMCKPFATSTVHIACNIRVVQHIYNYCINRYDSRKEEPNCKNGVLYCLCMVKSMQFTVFHFSTAFLHMYVRFLDARCYWLD